MPSDQEYLAKAGIDAETGGAAQAPDTASSAPEVTGTPEAKPNTEMFEVAGNQFPTNTEFKLTHDGKIVKVPYSTLANTYRQAQHLEGKYKSFNEDKAKFEQNKAEAERAMQAYKELGPLQEWSKTKPDEFKVIWDLYQNKDKHLLSQQVKPGSAPGQVGAQQQAPQQQFQPFVDEITNLKKTVGELMQTKQNWDQYQNQQRMERDTQSVLAEKDAFQKSYPEINLEERDPDGVSLWAKVMKHGVDQRIPNFKTAAMDYLESRLQDTWAARSRNEVVKGFKTDRQQGIVQRSATPITGQGQAKPINPKTMSYAEITEAAKNGRFDVSA